MLSSLNDYQEKAVRTLKRGERQLDDILHCVLGMVGEAGEVAEVIESDPETIMKEVGDSMWYAAALAYVMGLDLLSIHDAAVESLSDRSTLPFAAHPPEDRAHVWAGRLADRVKKSVFYGKVLDMFRVQSELVQYWACLVEHCYLLDMHILDVADKNIRKLEARYPAGTFDADRAINRDHEAEDKAMKGES